MKKILFIIAIGIGLIFNACNPMQDINDELDKALNTEDAKILFLKDKQVAPSVYTLTDEDYSLSDNANVKKYKNFSASLLPKDLLPKILNKKFSAKDGQSMMVTYNYYSKPVINKEHFREFSDSEYGEMGQSHGNFSNNDEAKALIAKLLDRKEYSSEIGKEITAKYVLFAKNQKRYIKVNADGSSEVLSYAKNAVKVTDAQYEATGNGKYKNFKKISIALDALAQLAKDEGTAPITYSCKVYLNFFDKYVVYSYNGSNWKEVKSVMPVTEELNYSLDKSDITKSYWWADPAVKITLTGDDYTVYPETSKYKNFDLRSGKVPGTDANKLVEMIGHILDTNYSAVEGQVYLVRYNYYDDSSGVGSIRIIKNGGSWSVPLTIWF